VQHIGGERADLDPVELVGRQGLAEAQWQDLLVGRAHRGHQANSQAGQPAHCELEDARRGPVEPPQVVDPHHDGGAGGKPRQHGQQSRRDRPVVPDILLGLGPQQRHL